MKKLMSVLALTAMMSVACSGLLGPTVSVSLPGADGLVAGQPVVLNGISIGEVRSVDFLDGTDQVVAELSISADGLQRLDPDTLFVVIRNKEEGPPRMMVATNICVDAPRGLTDGALLDGYSGGMAKIVLSAGADRPDCALKVAEDLLVELQTATINLEAASQ